MVKLFLVNSCSLDLLVRSQNKGVSHFKSETVERRLCGDSKEGKGEEASKD